MTPRVSVIVPVWNVAGHVADCLRSIAAQTLAEFEVIVVDDGSTDGSGEVARAAVAGDARFSFVTQPNAGLSAARNTGLARAAAPLIAFVDSDDRVAPAYLERLVGALEESGADWVSCGIEFHPAEAAPWSHSAIHGAWKIAPDDAPERHDFTDWREVARHFPSAWNKLYRRSVLGDLRFDAGMLYEDHAFYWRYAAKTDHLLRLPEPLYLSTQGRAGQITRDGSDAVFQQFDVLDILETVSAETPKAGRDTALARIATRLTFERSEAVIDRDRWARFLAAARGWMAAHGHVPDCALGVPPWWGEALAGQVPVSVVVPTDGQGALLTATLDSLSAQTCRAAEVLVVPDEMAVGEARAPVFVAAGAYPGVSVLAGARGLAAARNRGLAVARGGAVVFLDAGDTLPPGALSAWHKRLREAGAQMGFAAMRMGEGGLHHGGMHDRAGIEPDLLAAEAGFAPCPGDALAIHGHPSAKILDTGFLRREGIAFGPGALSSTHLLARVCARATRIVRIEAPPVRLDTGPGARLLWRAAVPATDLRAAIDAMAADAALTLPAGWQARLWARLVWEKLNHAEYGADQAEFEAEVARLSEGLREPGEAGFDPYVGPRVRKLIGLE
jgi:glycosyltransferase involved in cell wall biosynthesis